MQVYFNNDGSYGQSAIYRPVIFNDVPIGFISEVNNDRVTCYLWDRFINREQFGFNLTGTQDIRGISVEVGKYRTILIDKLNEVEI